MMLYRAKRRVVTADDIQDLVAFRGVPGKSGFYLMTPRKRLSIITKVTSKHRYPWVWVSESAFGAAPLTFGPAANFPSVGDAEDSELVPVIKAISDSRWQGSLFVPEDEDHRHPCPSSEAVEDPESEAGGSSVPLPDAGGTNNIRTLFYRSFLLFLLIIVF